MRTGINKEKIAKIELFDPVNNAVVVRDYWLIAFKNDRDEIYYSEEHTIELEAITAFENYLSSFGFNEVGVPEPPSE